MLRLASGIFSLRGEQKRVQILANMCKCVNGQKRIESFCNQILLHIESFCNQILLHIESFCILAAFAYMEILLKAGSLHKKRPSATDMSGAGGGEVTIIIVLFLHIDN